jgi:hypothetical protein
MVENTGSKTMTWHDLPAERHENIAYQMLQKLLLGGGGGHRRPYRQHGYISHTFFFEKSSLKLGHVDISGSHGGEYEDGSLLGYCAV